MENGRRRISMLGRRLAGVVVPLAVAGGALSAAAGAGGVTPAVKIDYTEHAVAATVETKDFEPRPTSTGLSTTPKVPVTNQPVTLTATVSPLDSERTVALSAGTVLGTVSFENMGVPIPGCESRTLAPAGSGEHVPPEGPRSIATCQAAFAAGSSREELTAVFTPSPGSEFKGSISHVENVTVERDTTNTGLSVSSTTPSVGAGVTYAATVTPSQPGASEPSGSVEFLEGGIAIGSCANQPLTQTAGSSVASCTLSYATAGSHTVTATYGSDLNFTASTSQTQEVVAIQASQPPPVEPKPAPLPKPEPPIVGKQQVVTVLSGTVTVRPKGATAFVPLTSSTGIPDGSELDATNGRIVITVATPNGHTASAELFGGRFRIHQDPTGETHFVLTLPLTGCPRVNLPRGGAAGLAHAARRRGPRSRHLWVSEKGGSWGTNGRFVSTSVEGTRWLTLDECGRSQVVVTAGKVRVRDLVRKRTKTLSAGKRYVAVA